MGNVFAMPSSDVKGGIVKYLRDLADQLEGDAEEDDIENIILIQVYQNGTVSQDVCGLTMNRVTLAGLYALVSQRV